MGGGVYAAGADDPARQQPGDAGFRHSPAAADCGGDGGHGARLDGCGRAGKCPVAGRPHCRGGADGAGSNSILRRTRRFSSGIQRCRKSAQFADGRGAFAGSAGGGGRQGRLQPPRRVGTVDAVGRRRNAFAGAEQDGGVRSGAGAGSGTAAATGDAGRERGGGDGQPVECARRAAGYGLSSRATPGAVGRGAGAQRRQCALQGSAGDGGAGTGADALQ